MLRSFDWRVRVVFILGLVGCALGSLGVLTSLKAAPGAKHKAAARTVPPRSTPRRRAVRPKATGQSRGKVGPRYLRDATALQRRLVAVSKRFQPMFQALKPQKEAIIREWIKIAEIPAPSKREQKRGAYIAAQFRAAGLRVSIDALGNVVGHLAGTGGTGKKGIAYIAHLDTVFDQSVSHKVRRRGEILHGPGVGDDTSGLIALVVLARMFKRHQIQFRRDVWFVASVQEEIGLVGARHFVTKHKDRLAAVASIDGGFGGISYGALGIEWYKVSFHGKGNHTLSSTGKPSTTHAVAKAIHEIYKLRVPQHPFMRRTWFNVGKMGAGRVFNAQASEAWFTLDLRSMSAVELEKMKRAVFGIVQTAAYKVGVQAKIQRVQRFPAAQIANGKRLYLVQAAAATLRALGIHKPRISPIGSSDHCTAVVLGIPGINIGITRGQGAHTLREQVSTKYLLKGLQHTALLLGVMAELAPAGRK